MFSSLRARLWLSYALLIAIVIVIVGVGLAWALLQNPRVLYPEAAIRLRLAGEVLSDPLERALAASTERAQQLLEREAASRGLRVVILDPDRQVLVDTGGTVLPLARMALTAQLRQQAPEQVRTVRSRTNKIWLFTARQFSNGYILLVLMEAPALRTALQERFFSTFAYAGLVALALSVLLALMMAGWITAPLGGMVAAARAVARGENPTVAVQGPGEVRELAQALNEMSQRVQASSQSQRDFVANVSHELKTPLTSIQGFAQAILDGAAQTPEALQQAAGVIFQEANRMNRLVLDLLSLARLEAGTADLQQTPVSMNLVLDSVVERLSPQAESSAVELRLESGDSLPVTGDGDRLAQVFTNLVDNAIKFSPTGGCVTVSAQAVGGSAIISVRDTGNGIAPEDHSRIFERFFQVDKSRRGGAGRGVGLGLAIARQIILAHDGKIWVESQPGQGSCFVVKIPLARADVSSITYKTRTKR